MRKHYDFSQGVRNPYAKRLKKQLTIRLDSETVDYFQGLAQEMSLPYQTLMNMYLRECATERRRPHWAPPRTAKRAIKASKRLAAGGGRR
ncbi:MAG TPA: BrnA antitoxin family protein [Polyangia bacterium]|nr:BrnA antitoxin family protein [Polyangia bacterium]